MWELQTCELLSTVLSWWCFQRTCLLLNMLFTFKCCDIWHPFLFCNMHLCFRYFKTAEAVNVYIFYVVIINGCSCYFVLPLQSICSNVVHASDPWSFILEELAPEICCCKLEVTVLFRHCVIHLQLCEERRLFGEVLHKPPDFKYIDL